MTYDHEHGFVEVRFGPIPVLGAIVFLVLQKLHLPTGWMVRSGPLPHHADCTSTEAVLDV